MKIPFTPNYSVGACLLLSVLSVASQAQQVPNSGTAIQEVPKAALQAVPSTVAPPLVVPNVQRALSVRDQSGWNAKVRISDFQISGNTLFDSATLLAKVANLKGQTVELDRVVEAMTSIRKVYQQAGYLLTDVYLPEQQFAPDGAVIQIAVVEAHIGKVNTVTADATGIPVPLVKSIVEQQLHTGAAIQQYELEKVVYLLKDLSGVDASATLSAGANVGEADITIEITPKKGSRVDASIGVDNMGVAATGEYNATAVLNVDHPLDMGDQLALRVQPTNRSGNALIRAGYTIPVGPYATKFNVSASDSTYKLGAPFEALGASGSAAVVSASLIQPLVRGRMSNSVVTGGLDHKSLKDTNAVSGEITQSINTARLGLLGMATVAASPTDAIADAAKGQSIFDNLGGQAIYSVVATGGKLTMNPVNADTLKTSGNYLKLNFDFSYVQYFAGDLSLAAGLSGQLASKNLSSSERVSFGGPNGVRGYAASTGTADEGAVLSLELRYKMPEMVAGVPVSASAFYDAASIHSRVKPQGGATPNTATFDSFGVGLRAGTEGKLTASLLVASRLGGPYPIPTDGNTSSVTERRPQFWFTLQNWF